MRIDALLASGATRSFEFFPPKSDEESATLATTLHDLEPLQPSFVSVTYRGGAESRQRTFDLVSRIQNEGQLTAMAHLICVGHTIQELRDTLTTYSEHGIDNVMALGGDVPEGDGAIRSDLAYAVELVTLAREVGNFAIGVAAHPMVHPRSTSLSSDRDFLAAKLDLADFAVTQFFFQPDEWVGLVNDLADRGVTKPVLPGIMPVTTLGGISRMAMMGAAVPEGLAARLVAADERGGPAGVRAEGILAATELCAQILAEGAPGLHFYTLNRSTATREIYANLFGKEGG